MKRNFVVTVKEYGADQPCALDFELAEDIGLGRKMVRLDMPDGTGLEEAKKLALAINGQAAKIRLIES